MGIKYIDEMALAHKKVFIRVDFNLPMKDGKIVNDLRLKESLPTIQHAREQGAKIILASHLGRPEGKIVSKLSLEPIAELLLFYLKESVIFSHNCEANGNKKIVQDMKEGSVLLLENLRFHPGEEANSVHFANQLSKLCNVYINDAFGAIHRIHASVEALPKIVSVKGAGFLIKKEIEALTYLLKKPKKPYTIIIGGKKVSDKIGLLNCLLDQVDAIIIGGAMAYTFLRAMGIKTGNSLVEEDKITVARDLLQRAKKNQVRLLLPIDHVVGKRLRDDTPVEVTLGSEVPDGWMGCDIGPKTIELYGKIISESQTVMWNGPLGAFEFKPFETGTKKIAETVGKNRGYTVVGGGDSVAAIQAFKSHYKFSHVSTGGGASLEFLEGKILPGLEALKS